MIERRVRDFRLDSRLRAACESDIFNTCAYLGDSDTVDSYDSTVINCLQVGWQGEGRRRDGREDGWGWTGWWGWWGLTGGGLQPPDGVSWWHTTNPLPVTHNRPIAINPPQPT